MFIVSGKRAITRKIQTTFLIATPAVKRNELSWPRGVAWCGTHELTHTFMRAYVICCLLDNTWRVDV